METQIPAIEFIKIFYSGKDETLRIISVKDIRFIEVDHIDKSINIILNEINENGFHKVESYYNTDKAYIIMRFTNVIRNN